MSDKSATSEIQESSDKFKSVYKRYKRRDRPCDVTDVIDFSKLHTLQNNKVAEFQLKEPDWLPAFPGLKPFSEWRAYVLKECPGFIVIPNPFKVKYQRYWIKRCLLDFSTKPNTTNLDAHMERPSQIWHNSINENNEPDLSKDSFLIKLRWATLGYQYEWNTKEYFSDKIQAFPDDLNHICSYIAAALGYNAYSSEAGIVNYYRMESTLMGHTDVSELDKAAPLISFSFGQSCIFLIGGPTKETEPVPLFLHSGDICLMTGEARLSYHAVPRIYPSDKLYFHSCFHDVDTDQATVISNQNTFCEPVDTQDKSVSKSMENKTTVISGDSKVNEKDMDSDTEDDPYSKSERKRIYIDNMEKIATGCDENIVETETVNGNKVSIDELAVLMDKVVSNTDWELFEKYVAQSRINLNVRQVLKAGLSLDTSPSVIVPCQGKK